MEYIEGENSSAMVWTLKEDTHWPTPSQEKAPPTASACHLLDMIEHVLDVVVASDSSESPGFIVAAPHDHVPKAEETPMWRTNEC
ncbi:uncharacterized protein N7473_013277 [Penicillium subrubescens]|uniref:uncharacterized protein n=1 Tax=Penicillium subrubescens TaxID=1316194 RepID=UPI0025456709|nr:uncharacterized protein N7473_013277 [Penicillium subrubescens]KAJ5873404.1 hypothetical protein N7473_013277 [Penicillium subrubescens]